MQRRGIDPGLRLRELTAEVDREFETILELRPGAYSCRAGCSDCCRARLAVTRVEEESLRRGMASLPGETRARFARRAAQPGRETCPALDDRGICEVYPFRPLICRSFGVPLVRRSEVPLIRPPVVDVCDLNLVGVRLESLPAEETIDQTDLERRLSDIDDDYCRRNGLPRGERISLTSILSDS